MVTPGLTLKSEAYFW